MPSEQTAVPKRLLVNFNRSPVDQVMENLKQALRVLELIPSSKTELTPHPLVIVRAEIENARRYLSLLRVTEVADQDAQREGPMLKVA